MTKPGGAPTAMGCYEIRDDRFRDRIHRNAFIETIATGMLWAEGPVYFGDGNYLIWSDIPNNRMMRWLPGTGVEVYRADSNYANGNTRDCQGRLVSCEHGGRRVTRTEYDGTIAVLADNYQGRKLNSPNDVVVKSDGSVWFTDPPYGILSDYEGNRAEMELDGCYVFRVDPETGGVDIVVDDMVKPNGLAFSPDESILYVADSGVSHDPDGPHHIRAYDVCDGQELANGRVFAEIDPGLPDGFRLDTDGYLWTSARDGVHCYAPDGTLMGKILTPERVSNLTFGGPKKNRLFMTATTSVYSIYTNSRGAQTP
ncbi:MAG: SMP-30/gluconolactonase/LRE family protein [Pseudomonadota bacterium]